MTDANHNLKVNFKVKAFFHALSDRWRYTKLTQGPPF